jgi:hypothetical protein
MPSQTRPACRRDGVAGTVKALGTVDLSLPTFGFSWETASSERQNGRKTTAASFDMTGSLHSGELLTINRNLHVKVALAEARVGRT